MKVEDVARQLAHMLLALTNGEPLAEQQINIGPKLIIMDSTGG